MKKKQDKINKSKKLRKRILLLAICIIAVVFLTSLKSNKQGITLNRAGLAVKQTELAYNTTKNQVTDLKIISTGSGIVQGLSIKYKKGSYVNNAMEICQIKDADKYEVKLQFTKSFADNINIGDFVENVLFYLDYI